MLAAAACHNAVLMANAQSQPNLARALLETPRKQLLAV